MHFRLKSEKTSYKNFHLQIFTYIAWKLCNYNYFFLFFTFTNLQQCCQNPKSLLLKIVYFLLRRLWKPYHQFEILISWKYLLARKCFIPFTSNDYHWIRIKCEMLHLKTTFALFQLPFVCRTKPFRHLCSLNNTIYCQLYRLTGIINEAYLNKSSLLKVINNTEIKEEVKP